MSENVYRIYGAEPSPYSVKVRSYFRYKGIPHEWINRSLDKMPEFQKHAKLPLIPLVVTPEGESMQDSTPIIEKLEQRFPEPAVHPSDTVRYFLSALLEEFADEWMNKPMFHYRWFYSEDREADGKWLAECMMPGAPEQQIAQMKQGVIERMVPRLKFVGSSEETKHVIEGSYERVLGILEPHFSSRPYLFGGKPCFADFALFGQLYENRCDPTPGAILRQRAPSVSKWIDRMLDPAAESAEWESWASLEPTLGPLLEEAGRMFFPWSEANARALAAGEKTFTVVLDGKPFTQEPQKYHAKSLGALRERYGNLGERSELDPILERAGCLEWLRK